MDCAQVERESIPERYLAGTLHPQLKEEWELHYFACDHCAELLATWQAIDKPLRSMADSIRREIAPRRNVGRWVGLGAAIAATLLVAWGVRTIATRGNHPTPSIAASQAPPATAPPEWQEFARLDPPDYQPQTLRATGTSAEVQFQKAMESYVRHDYPQAAAGLKTAVGLDPSAAAPRFFLGASEILAGNPTDGIADLEHVASGDSPFVREAQFDLAKAYLMRNERDRAVDILRKLAGAPGDFQTQATQLLALLTPR